MDGLTFFQTLSQNNKNVTAPTVQFSGSDETNSFPVKGEEVNISTSDGNHDVGSSKLKIKNIVNFGWEHRYYLGQLVSAHISGTYIAYAITTPGKNQGVIRIVNRTTDDRILMKGMRGAVKDLGFAHVKDEVIIGCIDELGNLFVHRVIESSSGMASERIVEVVRDGPPSEHHRLIWCPYLPEVADEDDDVGDSAGKLLVITHGEKAEMWNLDMVVEAHGPGPLAPQDVSQGVLSLADDDLGGNITDAAFSPDGTALATASEDGEVKFFQVYMLGEGAPRCLHHWKPHEGKPLSALFFLDNHSDYNPDIQFWKFAVTGCDKNSELKIWSCETWTCLQTIRFQRPQGDIIRMKASLDLTARYLLLADIDRRLVYVLSLDLGNSSQGIGASVVSVSEFASPASFLSFCCVSAGRRQVRLAPDGMTVEDEDGSDSGATGEKKDKTVVRVYLVQPKSLQECSIIFDDAARSASSSANVSHESIMFQDAMSDMNLTDRGDSESSKLSASIAEATMGDASPRLSDSSSDRQNGDVVRQVLSSSYLSGDGGVIPVKMDASLIPVIPVASMIPLPTPSPASVPLPQPGMFRMPSATKGLFGEVERTSSPDILNSTPTSIPPEASTLSLLSNDQQMSDSNQLNLSTGHDQLAEAASKITNQLSMSAGHDQLTEAASKITLLSPDQFVVSSTDRGSPPGTTHSSNDEEEFIEVAEDMVEVKLEELSFSDTNKISKVIPNVEAEVVSGGSSPSREVADILAVDEPRYRSPSTPSPLTIARMEDMIRQLQHHVKNLNGQLIKEQKQVRELTSTVSKQIGQLEKGMVEQREAMMETISQTVVARLDQAVQAEFRRSMPSAVSRAMEPLTGAINAQMSNKLSTTDKLLRENIEKMMTSRAVSDTIAQTVKAVIQPVVTDSYRQAFQHILLPNVEKSMGSLLQQINQQFLAGTKDYETALRQHLEINQADNKAMEDKLARTNQQLQGLAEAVAAGQSQLAAGQSQLAGQIRELKGGSNQEALLVAIKEVVNKEVTAALGRGDGRSVSNTPAPDHTLVNLQAKVQANLQAGKCNEAFQTALSANDLSLVVYTCEMLNTTQVFNQANCPFSQSVLLSLIQQLSVDLQDKTELKHRYLSEAVVNLDVNNPTTKQHMAGVMAGMRAALQFYIQANPNSKMTRNMRMLLLATQSLGEIQ